MSRSLRPFLCLTLSLVACGGVESDEVDEEIDQASAEAVVTTGVPFGPMQLPEEEWGARFNATFIAMWPGADKAYLLDELDLAVEKKTALSIQLSPNRKYLYLDNACSDGNGNKWDCGFDFNKWKQYVDRFKLSNGKGMDLSSYVSQGVLLAHYIVDEPFCAECWNGKAIPVDKIEQAAQYSKQLWPYLPTVIRVAPSKLVGKNLPSLDAGWAQYVVPATITSESAVAANVSSYVANEVDTAKDLGLGLFFSANVINGGIRSGNCAIDLATQSDRCSMSKQTLLTVADKMLRSNYACSVGMWSRSESFNGDTYFARSDIRSAVDSTLKPLARSRTRQPCKR